MKNQEETVTHDCSRLLTVAHDCSRLLTISHIFISLYSCYICRKRSLGVPRALLFRSTFYMLTIAHDCSRLLTIAHDCSRLLTIAHDCSRLLTIFVCAWIACTCHLFLTRCLRMNMCPAVQTAGKIISPYIGKSELISPHRDHSPKPLCEAWNPRSCFSLVPEEYLGKWEWLEKLTRGYPPKK